ncbi:hypothetical protein Bca101_093835 [Brassica carinata]
MNSKIVDQMPPATPSTPFDDSSEDAINAAVDLELAAAVGGVRGDSNGGRRSKAKGPWSTKQDAVLTRLVNKLGPMNWTLIARGISGGWCNQLDPCLKRKPFTGSLLFETNQESDSF